MTDEVSVQSAGHDGAVAPQGPKVDGVRWRYHSGFYDGPLSGQVELPDGREAWADMIEECGCYDSEADEWNRCGGFYRRYQLWRLAPEQAATEAERHADFRRWVGTHADRRPDGTGDRGAVHPQDQWQHFYDKWGHAAAEGTDPRASGKLLDGAEPIGWFEL